MRKHIIRVFSVLFLTLTVLALTLSSACNNETPTPTKTSPTTTATSAAASTTASATQPASTTAAASTTQAAASTPASSATPKYGGTLRMVVNWSPTNATGWPPDIFGPEGTTLQFCMEALLTGDKQGNMKPWLAESYKVADDLMSITFKLRKDVKFHDGTPFNAQAAKWNMEQEIAAKKQQYWKSVEVIDEYTVKVNFTKWTNTNVNDFGGSYAFMVSPTAYEKNGLDWMRNNPVATGPFKYQSFQKDVNYKFVKNPDYWIKGRPYLDGVEVIYVTDPMTQKSVLLSGGTDLLQAEPGKMAHDLQAQGYEYKSDIITVYSLLPDNGHADSPFANPKVMEAIDYSIDREAIAKAFSYGFWSATYQVPPPSQSFYDPNFPLATKYDLVKAKALLAEAGYPGGFKTTLLNNTSIPHDFAQYLQASMAAINIQAEISFPETVGAFIESSNSMNNVLVLQPLMSIPNYNSAIYLFLLGKDSLWNHNFKPTDEFLKLREASLFSPVYDSKLVKAATDLLSKEHQVIPFAQAGMGWVTQSYIKDAGFCTRGSTDLFDIINMWLDK